ncbi:MAG: hypothetical protein GXO86_01380 [Chlorobi bacterium]|nr:hypothetical protein [Chlorobiota bacterium]
MDKLILNIKDSSKLSFIVELLKQFDFIEVIKVKRKKVASKHDFFNSAGMWANRDINGKELRKQAWDRTK